MPKRPDGARSRPVPVFIDGDSTKPSPAEVSSSPGRTSAA